MRVAAVALSISLLTGCYAVHDSEGRAIGGGGSGDGSVLLVLELLPQEPGGPGFARVQARYQEGNPFEVAWAGLDVAPTALEPERSTACYRVRADEGQNLHVRVSLCHDRACLDFEDVDPPELRLAIEAPIYAGRETVVNAAFTPAPLEIRRCQVQGCIEGAATSFCLASGEHFCEVNEPIDRSGLFRCPDVIPTFELGDF